MEITKLNFYIQQALPAVYDDSLSFVELLGRVVAKVNELVDSTNDYLNQDLETYVSSKLTEWKNDGTLASIIADDALLDIGSRTYTEQNYVTSSETVTDSIDALDMGIASHLAEKATKQELNLKADKTYVNTLTQSIASGSPKGVYGTYAELETAKPSGDSNIYIVEADGNWYYWNGTDWTAGGLYQSVLMNQTAPIKIDGIEWERGSLSGGIEFVDYTRIRTKGFLQFKGKAVINAQDGYKVGITIYVNGVFESQTAFDSTPKIIEYDANKEYRLTIAKTDDSEINISESDALLLELELPEAIEIMDNGLSKLKNTIKGDIAQLLEWEIGSLSGDNETADIRRVRTINHLFIDHDISLYLKDNSYKYAVITYNKTTGLYASTSGWLNFAIDIPYNENHSYRFIVAKQDDATMEVSEYKVLAINANASEYLPLISNKIENLPSAPEAKEFFVAEINDTISKIKLNTTEKTLVFAVMSDSHTYKNARQYIEDCSVNIGTINNNVPIDGVFHLGDMINGSNTIEEDTENIEYVRDTLLNVHDDVFFAFGNHDDISYGTHYTDGDYLTKGESYRLTHRHNERKVYREGSKLYYYIDYPTVKLRIIVLDSISIEDGIGYDSADDWGYSLEQLNWVETVALDTDYNILVFSHNPAIAGMNYTNIGVANGTQLTTLLENWQTIDKKVLCFMSGHTHADKIDTVTNSFAHITIGTQHATNNELLAPGAVSPERTPGTVTQDLWDIMIIQFESRKIKLIRFGAGEDRTIDY